MLTLLAVGHMTLNRLKLLFALKISSDAKGIKNKWLNMFKIIATKDLALKI